MESKPQRRTRIFDENDPAVIAAAGRHRKTASTASTKSTASTRPRASHNVKRVALVDSTRHETDATSKASSQASKGSLSKPAVRGKPLAAKSNASLATGAKSVQQPSNQRAASTSIKSTIYRDPQETQAKGPVKSGRSETSIGETRAQATRKKQLVYRDEPEPALSTARSSGSVPTPAVAVHTHDYELKFPGQQTQKLATRALHSKEEPIEVTPAESLGPVADIREESETQKPAAGWDDDDDDLYIPSGRFGAANIMFADKPCLANVVKEDDNKPVYNPMRQLVQSNGKWNYYPSSGWASHEKDTRALGFGDEEDEAVQLYVGLEEYTLFQQLGAEYRAREQRNGEGDRARVYPEYTPVTDLEVVEGLMTYAKDPGFKYLDTSLPGFAEEYAPDILRHTWAVDRKMQPDPHYMDTQPYLQWHMRGILVDWLIEVHERFQLDVETLFNTVNIIDRFLSVRVVPVHQLQLVGLAAMLIASKFDEITPPSIDMLVYMADQAFTGQEIRGCEQAILGALEWEVSAPGPMSFLRCLSCADTWDKDVRDLGQYFLEAALTELRFVGTPWSYVVAAAYYVSMIILDTGRGEWTPAHIYYSGHCASQLAPAVQVLIEMMNAPEEHHRAVFTKYNRKNHRRIAGFVERWMVAQFAHVEEPVEGLEAAQAEGRERETEIRIQRGLDRERRRRMKEEVDR
ncbi:hypothetical protein TWF281_009238 [Arthrobotrys megalospora]